ncbi:MAG: hypothetical protein KBD78_09865 [Oligoflexales bacterium]|nr:hypothetical protein [Oligoflexales bacterium]
MKKLTLGMISCVLLASCNSFEQKSNPYSVDGIPITPPPAKPEVEPTFEEQKALHILDHNLTNMFINSGVKGVFAINNCLGMEITRKWEIIGDSRRELETIIDTNKMHLLANPCSFYNAIAGSLDTYIDFSKLPEVAEGVHQIIYMTEAAEIHEADIDFAISLDRLGVNTKYIGKVRFTDAFFRNDKGENILAFNVEEAAVSFPMPVKFLALCGLASDFSNSDIALLAELSDKNCNIETSLSHGGDSGDFITGIDRIVLLD